ncbi:MAG TPA: precorrin-2 C(20)-methyltransferase [Anaeromyxobacteraceae bacterium]|nr:precorrin-2 C(20)-methyltransferase [Anaeromyxobacteraceae bacterium]
MTARLQGVGVGPGAPDLLTLRAARVLREADVLALPRSSPEASSAAGAIVRAALGEVPGQETLLLTFPMTRDPALRRAALDAALDALAIRLAAGKTVAVACEGDPLVYGSFIDILQAAPARFPGVPVEVVPGITAATAAAAAALVPLADGDGALEILPARRALAELPRIAARGDAAVIYKAGPALPELAGALAASGLARRAVLVTSATRADEEIVRGLEGAVSKRPYFSLVIVPPGPGPGEPER